MAEGQIVTTQCYKIQSKGLWGGGGGGCEAELVVKISIYFMRLSPLMILFQTEIICDNIANQFDQIVKI